MFKAIKNESGITLIVLVAIIVILLIIAGAAIYEGKDLIKDAKMETLETDMLEIKSKAKVYIEQIEAKTWAIGNTSDRNESIISLFREYDMEEVQINELSSEVQEQINVGVGNKRVFDMTSTTLEYMGLSELAQSDVEYKLVFNSNDYNQIDIILEDGIKYNNQRFYTLSAIQKEFNEN